jgi:hypothetical protein
MVTPEYVAGYDSRVLYYVRGYLAFPWTAVSALVVMIIAEIA